jgi:competence protein ComEC
VALLVVSEPVSHRPDAQPAPGWRTRLLHAIRGCVHTQAVATVGLAPLSMFFFQQVSVVGLPANLLAIPLVTLLITPLALLGVVLPPLWMLAAELVAFLRLLLGWLSGLALGRVARRGRPALGHGLPVCWGRLWPCCPCRGGSERWPCRSCCRCWLPPVPRPAQGEFEVVAADIGQGTAVLVRTARHLLVYDAGPAYSTESDAGVRVLAAACCAPAVNAASTCSCSATAMPITSAARQPCWPQTAGAAAVDLVGRRASVAGRRRAAPALRRRPVLVLGWGAVRGPAPAGR